MRIQTFIAFAQVQTKGERSPKSANGLFDFNVVVYDFIWSEQEHGAASAPCCPCILQLFQPNIGENLAPALARDPGMAIRLRAP